MKKALSFLLCLVLMLTLLASCNNDETATSIENSIVSENPETSETSQEIKLPPENTLYFTEYYCISYEHFSRGIFGNEKIAEVDSYLQDQSTGNENGLGRYLENNNVDDAYFMVGVSCHLENPQNDYDIESKKAIDFLRTTLAEYNFLQLEEHPMKFDSEYYKKWMTLTSSKELFALDIEYLKKKLPNIDFDFDKVQEGSKLRELNKTIYRIVGYISGKDLKALAENYKGDREIFFTWFPAPDDQERWLTIDPKYRE